MSETVSQLTSLLRSALSQQQSLQAQLQEVQVREMKLLHGSASDDENDVVSIESTNDNIDSDKEIAESD